MRYSIRIAGVALSAALYFFSLWFCTLLYADDSTFLVGIICLLFGLEYLPWYANPFIFASAFFLTLDKPRWAVSAAVIANILALTTFSIRQIERDEAGTLAPVTGYGVGFYLWLSCSFVLLATSTYCVIDSGRSTIAALED